MTIDVAKLRSLARYQNDAVITAEEITELLDAYEERDRLRDENERAAQLAVEATHLILRLREERERLRAALDGPMARLIAAARDMPIDHRNGRWEILHFPGISPVPGCVDCAAVVELRAAIDYAEQRRVQG